MGCGCGCIGTTSGASMCSESAAAALHGDPLAVRQTMGGFLPDIVWPSDVEAFKRKLDPQYLATEAAARACSALPSGVLAGWRGQFEAYMAFSKAETGTFGASNAWELAHKYERELLDWQNTIGASCALNAPKVQPENRDAPDLSWLKYVAVAAAILGVAYVAAPLVTAATVARKARGR